MFVALSRFQIANGMEGEVKEAFRNRPHLVEDAPGFLRLEVLSPVDHRDEIWLFTYWADEESFRIRHKGHTYREAHKGIPKGLKLVPKSASIRHFEHVSD